MNAGSSKLVALLRDWKFAEAVPVAGDWVEQLGGWLGAVDAITLSAAHQSISHTVVQHARPIDTSQPERLQDDLCKVRADLMAAIGPSKLVKSRDMRNSAPVKLAETVEDAQREYAPYRQRYAEAQRRMDWRIDPLRSRCRQVLSQGNPQLRKLAELDTTIEHIFGAREKALFTKLPLILERRFEDLKRQHQTTPQSAQCGEVAETDKAPLEKSKALAWVAQFDKDFQAFVSAEIDARLEPIAGMIDAYGQETLAGAASNTLKKV